jgi:hypothetical protein
VRTCDDIYEVGLQRVVDGIREAAEESPAQPHSDFRKGFREVRDSVNNVFERLGKLVAEAWTLCIVPFSGQHHVRSRLRAEADIHS